METQKEESVQKKKFNYKILLRAVLALLFAALLIAVIILALYTDEKNGVIMGSEYSFVTKGVHSKLCNANLISIIEEKENLFSTEKENSDIFNINNAPKGEQVKISSETMGLLLLARELYVKTDGAFNIAIYPLIELWKFSPSTFNYAEKQPPSDSDIDSMLQYCKFDADTFILDKENLTVTKKYSESKLDPGAMVKGYNLDIARQNADDYGISYSLYSFGGSSILGYKKSYNIGIIDPNNKERVLGSLLLPENMCISTSGTYERFYKDSAGNIYHHILATDGKPSTSGITGVTVIGESGVLCDMISTAVIVMGLDKGRELMLEYGLTGIIVTQDNKYSTVGNIGFYPEIDDYIRI